MLSMFTQAAKRTLKPTHPSAIHLRTRVAVNSAVLYWQGPDTSVKVFQLFDHSCGSQHWVVVKKRKLSYHIGETLFRIYTH